MMPQRSRSRWTCRPIRSSRARCWRGGRPTWRAVAGRGGFLDYDLLFVTGDELRSRLDALLELGLFDQIGVLISGFRAGDVANGERDFARLDTTFTRDFPGRRASLRLGDSLTEGGALGRPVRFGGIQWSTDFSTDPTFVTFPLPTIGGLASQPSVAEVFLNNTRRVTEEVPPGPFAIEDLPALTGAGELQLKVTDLLGRETLVTQSYYVSSRLLRAGLSEYSYEVGFEREKFNQASFDYGKPLAAATQRYGITDGLTGEGRIEVSERQQTLGGGGSVLLGTLGLVSGGVVGSRHGGEPGFAAFARLRVPRRPLRCRRAQPLQQQRLSPARPRPAPGAPGRSGILRAQRLSLRPARHAADQCRHARGAQPAQRLGQLQRADRPGLLPPQCRAHPRPRPRVRDHRDLCGLAHPGRFDEQHGRVAGAGPALALAVQPRPRRLGHRPELSHRERDRRERAPGRCHLALRCDHGVRPGRRELSGRREGDAGEPRWRAWPMSTAMPA